MKWVIFLSMFLIGWETALSLGWGMVRIFIPIVKC